MTEWGNWIEQVLDLATRIDAADDFGALHIVVSDGNMEDEHIEFCLNDARITAKEISLANDLLYSEIELRCFSYWLTRNIKAQAQLRSLLKH